MRFLSALLMSLAFSFNAICEEPNPFLGEWLAVKAESNSRSLPDGIVKATQFVFENRHFSLYGKKLRYSFNPLVTPHTFESGEQRGVYREEGKLMRLCVGPADLPATTFSTKERTDASCYTLNRGKFDPHAVPWNEVVPLVSNADKKLESLAYRILTIQDPKVIGMHVIRGLSDKNRLVRGRMALLAREFKMQEAVPALAITLKKDLDFQVRVTCAHALGNIRGEASVNALKGGLSDSDPRVVDQIKRELKKLGAS